MALSASHIQVQPHTYDDFRSIPEDGHRYELIFGEIVISPSPHTKHQHALGELFTRMKQFVHERQLGRVYFAPVDVKLSPNNVVQPDLLFVKRQRLRIVRNEFIDGAPDLVVEALSPANRMRDLVKKAVLYGLHGVPEYWIVDPETNTMTVHIWRDGQYVAEVEDGVSRSAVLAGFEVRPAELFELPDWMSANPDETE